MKKNKTSRAWVHDHLNDPYVQRAQAEGYRARAAYKLLEVDERDHLLKPGAVVVDLGSTPGSWCQVAVKRCGPKGQVFALDVLPMEAVAGVDFLQGDFTEDAVLEDLESRLKGARADVVLSDMAPNLSGVAAVDQARSIHLCELALDFAVRHLKPGGQFLVKVFQGEGFMEYRKQMEAAFASVQVRKPKASRDRSAEVYLLGKGPRPV
ncbi:RlmE family RNA methyltransferase [Thauera linaloolentis]|uniref:Ribosomal RNA large subunit methyltransferase E n=1 Tax=Thauera linaloolentis (strain DSM 12138 / JCM 21573 / CCUG 41526 / CIP 105981 / IAM 15112 / NBRC 102519 / 47Lol) TaxID=1123367 RepID=N6Z6R5_THAL4|nr:RlmE family RNA methyltransferase [Thauera linaloolentis]ENO90058.1 23S rRNA methyltransferase J [Thauera linaloolentis 47Lol = DSM 12138]MCM8565342.1 RlmE family RNA methyltransferase [Thauera linaloolentis]